MKLIKLPVRRQSHSQHRRATIRQWLPYILVALFIAALFVPATSYAQCANPAANAKAIKFNSSTAQLQYCDGSVWKAMGPPPSIVGSGLPANGLVGWWKLDETSGTLADSSGSGNDGIQSGGIEYASTGIIGNAVGFDGIDDYIRLPDDPNIKLALPFSLALWFKPNDTNGGPQKLFQSDDYQDEAASYNGFLMEYSTVESINITYGNGIGVGPSARESKVGESFLKDPNRWYHITGVYRGPDDMDIYINGANDDGAYSGTGNTIAYSSYQGKIGGVSSGLVDGRIDDVRLYNRALTADEIAQCCAVTAHAPLTNGLVSHWKLEDRTGSSTIDSAGSNDAGFGGGLGLPGDFVNGPVGNALWFNGVNDVLLSNYHPVYTGIDDFSIGFWFKPDLANYAVDAALFGADDVGTTRILIQIDGDASVCPLDDQILIQIDDNVADGNDEFCFSFENDLGWNFVTLVYDVNGNISAYFDGRFVGSIPVANSSGTKDFTVEDFSIGAFNQDGTNVDNFDGQIDDVRIYDRALTADEVAQLYRAADGRAHYNTAARVPEFFNGDQWVPMGRIPSEQEGLIGWWKLDETTGLNVKDYSPLANDGTFNGEAVVASSAGILGTAFNFDGVDDEVLIPPIPEYGVGTTGSLSTAFWFQTLPSAPSLNLWIENGGTQITQMNLDVGRLRPRVRDHLNNLVETTVGALNTYNDGNWHHAAVTVDRNTNRMKVYLNGSEEGDVGASALVGTIGPENANIILGDGADEPVLLDDLRLYDRVLTPTEVAELYAYGTADPCGAANNPAIGTVCDDGSIYAGISPDGGMPMFMADINSEITDSWNDGSTNFLDSSLVDCASVPPCDPAGEMNTATLIADDASTAAGFQNHIAAKYCSDLSAQQHSDWYLPSIAELNLIYNGGTQVGDIKVDGTFYWASNEQNLGGAWYQQLSTGIQNTGGKENLYAVRCVRTGPLLNNCANPTRKEGTIAFNTNFNLMQYCDGRDWRKIGP